MGEYILKAASDGKFMWNLRAGNHEVILTSETYSSKQAAIDGIAAARSVAALADRYHRAVSSNGKDYFTLVAANGKTLGRSELYESKGGMENGIKSCQTNGPASPTVDKTQG
jgi:hypothetical protein